jgi:hypothetical protein
MLCLKEMQTISDGISSYLSIFRHLQSPSSCSFENPLIALLFCNQVSHTPGYRDTDISSCEPEERLVCFLLLSGNKFEMVSLPCIISSVWIVRPLLHILVLLPPPPLMIEQRIMESRSE